MAAGTYNLSIEQGSSWELSLALSSSPSTSMNLTDFTIAAKLAKSYYDDNPISMTSTVIDASQGKFKLSLTSSQTSELDYSVEYIYDVNITSPTGKVTRLIQGRATISPGVT